MAAEKSFLQNGVFDDIHFNEEKEKKASSWEKIKEGMSARKWDREKGEWPSWGEANKESKYQGYAGKDHSQWDNDSWHAQAWGSDSWSAKKSTPRGGKAKGKGKGKKGSKHSDEDEPPEFPTKDDEEEIHY